MLALIYLGSLYAMLDECVGNVVQSVGRYNVVTSRGFKFSANVHVGEIRNRSPKPIEHSVVETSEVVSTDET